MATTQTQATTSSWTRTRLLLANVREVLRLTTDIDDATLKRVFDTGIQERLISGIVLAAESLDGERQGELTMTIDWERNSLHVKEGRGTVIFDKDMKAKWRDGVSPQVDEIASLFRDFGKEKGCVTKWLVWYRKGVDDAATDMKLGLEDAEVPTWANGEILEEEREVKGLDELGLKIRLVD